ncbi:hypothetical protein D1AOALGA4SA_11908 [Olavius algarvensis Delta 1 endosymbiont]|nr:hypothetical protein D1AOALGA4SA_11908 [Olavius algarvensis Delta 1 endosymbiont]
MYAELSVMVAGFRSLRFRIWILFGIWCLFIGISMLPPFK